MNSASTPMNGPPAIAVRGLRKVFRQTTTGQSVVAIDRLDLNIAPREVDGEIIVHVVLHNGCGDAVSERDLYIGVCDVVVQGRLQLQ